MMNKKKVTIILTILFVFVLLFSHIFVIAEAEHECSGEDCPVCKIIAIVSDTIKLLSLVSLLAFFCFAIGCGFLKILHIKSKTHSVLSLISLKVKLSN